jgi:hypothetical protein
LKNGYKIYCSFIRTKKEMESIREAAAKVAVSKYGYINKLLNYYVFNL